MEARTLSTRCCAIVVGQDQEPRVQPGARSGGAVRTLVTIHSFNGEASGNLRVDGGEPVDRFRYAATSIDARPRWRRYISAAQSHAGCCRSLSRSRSAASGNGPGNGYGNSPGNRMGKSSAAAVKSATVKLAPTRYPDG